MTVNIILILYFGIAFILAIEAIRLAFSKDDTKSLGDAYPAFLVFILTIVAMFWAPIMLYNLFAKIIQKLGGSK